MRHRSGVLRCGSSAFAQYLIGAVLFVMAPTNAIAACSVKGQFRLTSEGPWVRSMGLMSGETCSGFFRSRRGGVFFKRLYLVTPPQHGTVKLREGGYYQYFSKAGYHGSDNFMLRICGNVNGRDSCANLKYDVVVQ